MSRRRERDPELLNQEVRDGERERYGRRIPDERDLLVEKALVDRWLEEERLWDQEIREARGLFDTDRTVVAGSTE